MRHSEHYTPWHGHITALTVAPAFRRMGYARRLTESLERASDVNDAWFVDLYVRESNKVAVSMYEGMGYVFPRAKYRGDLTMGPGSRLIESMANERDPLLQVLRVPACCELLQR